MAMVLTAMALSVLAGASAHATCTQADGAGTWRAFFTAGSDADISWLRCTIRLNASGVVGANSFCFRNNGTKVFATAGQVTIASSCAVSGSFTLAGLVKNIVDGQLSQDKTIMAGVGKDNDGSFTFTALKK